jgi:GNAT superfamily N-acetyltransferase
MSKALSSIAPVTQHPIVEVRACNIAEIIDDPATPELISEYERECSYPQLGPPSPQLGMYRQLESLGCAQSFAAYLDGRLCGFGFLIMGPTPHYGIKLATAESLFVASAVRRNGLGAQLMRVMEAHAKEAACVGIFYSTRVGSRGAKLLSSLSDEYHHTNQIFLKRLA